MNLILETERLYLRPLHESDLDLSIEMLTDPDITHYIYDDRPYTREEVIAEMPLALRRCAQGCIGIWCILEKATITRMGTTFLLPLPVDEDDTNFDLIVGDELPKGDIEIGYILRKAGWGKGYATEAAARLIRFAFEETPLEEIVAVVDAGNKASLNIMDKLGFADEGLRYAYKQEVPGFRIRKTDWLLRQST